jgi:hypothetical protein
MKTRIDSISVLLICIMIISYSSLAYKYINTGDVNADEDFYLLAAKKVMDGELLYRDFGYSQMPVLPYLNGAMMKLVGFGFVEQRFINSVWGALILVLIIILGFSNKDLKPFLCAGLILSTSPYWIYYTCIGKTYAATGFFMTFAAFGILMPMKYHIKAIIVLLGGLLAIGCRLSVAPFVFLLWGILFFQSDTSKQRIAVVCFYLVICAGFFLPFYLSSPENFMFWNIEYNTGSSFSRRGWTSVYEFLLLAPGTLLLASIGILIFFKNFQDHKVHEVGIFITAMVGITFHLLLRASYGEYSTPFIALLSLGAAVVAFRSEVFKIVIIVILLSPLIYLKAPLPPRTQENIVALIKETSEFIRATIPKGAKILTPLTLIAVQAGYDVVKGSEMGKFGLTTEIEVQRARRLGLLPYQDLISLVETQTPKAIIFGNRLNWNFFWTVPSLKPVKKEFKNNFYQKLSENYYVAFYNAMFLVFLPK